MAIPRALLHPSTSIIEHLFKMRKRNIEQNF